MWCIPNPLDQEYIMRMENLLKLYQRPYNPKKPVICMDEKSVLLRKDTANPQLARPGKIGKQHHQYKREGTANTFISVEPKTGRYISSVTLRRTRRDYAKYMDKLAKKYSDAKVIHLVQDNLNIHSIKSFIEYYGEEEGYHKWKRFKIHYTPKNASWLNQAEIAISIYSRQCLGKRRIPDIKSLRKETNKWNRKVNSQNIAIDWSFTTKKARKKFSYEKSAKGLISNLEKH